MTNHVASLVYKGRGPYQGSGPLLPPVGITPYPTVATPVARRELSAKEEAPVPSMRLARADVWENLLRTPGLEAPYRTLDLGAYPYPRTIGAEGEFLTRLRRCQSLSRVYSLACLEVVFLEAQLPVCRS